MPEEKQPSGFSASDIRRYTAGEMTAAEMHALESAAARDPFLAEALEGYTSLPTEKWEQPLAELHARFRQQQTTKIYRMRYMKAAAAILLLGLTVAVAYLFTGIETGNSSELAVHTSPETVPSEVPVVQEPVPSDTAPVPQAEADATVAVAPDRTGKMSTEPSKAAEPVSDSSFIYRPSPAVAAAPTQNPPARAEDMDVAAGNAENRAETMAVEPTGNAAMNEVITSNAYNNRAKMNPQAQVRNAEGVAPKKSIPVPEASGKGKSDNAKESFIHSGDAVPVTGWEQYRVYLQQEKRNPEVVQRNKMTGQVVLTLHLLPDGRIEKIDISRSLHPDCDAEAVRLIREGPGWKINAGLKSASVQVSVPF